MLYRDSTMSENEKNNCRSDTKISCTSFTTVSAYPPDEIEPQPLSSIDKVGGAQRRLQQEQSSSAGKSVKSKPSNSSPRKPIAYFDVRNPEHRTCGCDCCHAKISLVIIAVIDIIGACITFLFTLMNLIDQNYYENLGVYCFAGMINWIFPTSLLRMFAAILAVFAMKHTLPRLLIPYVILQGFYAVMFLPALIVVSSLTALNQFNLPDRVSKTFCYDEEKLSRKTIQNGAAAICFLLVAFWVIMIIFFVIFIRGFNYLRAKRSWLDSQRVRYSIPSIAIDRPGSASAPPGGGRFTQAEVAAYNHYVAQRAWQSSHSVAVTLDPSDARPISRSGPELLYQHSFSVAPGQPETECPYYSTNMLRRSASHQ